MANIESSEPPGSCDVLAAVLKLFTDERFQDVRFVCSDGNVNGNRAFLAARCCYFEKLLFGALLEGNSADIRLQAPSAAVKHVLHYLHTGSFSSIEACSNWLTLMETCALAQQYMLPPVVENIAGRVLTDLQPDSLGLTLSYALKAGLQPVIKNIWIATPRLLLQPLSFDDTFSAEAICFCLQHTAWLAAPAAAAGDASSSNSSRSSSSGALTGAASQQPLVAGRASNSSIDLAPRAAAGTSSSAVREEEAFNAVLAWVLNEVAGCADCQTTRQERDTSISSTTPHKQLQHLSAAALCDEQQQPQPQPPLMQQHPGMVSPTGGCGTAGSGAAHPATGWCASSRSLSRPASGTSSTGGRHYSAAGTAAAGRSSDSDSDLSTDAGDGIMSSSESSKYTTSSTTGGYNGCSASSSTSSTIGSAAARKILTGCVSSSCSCGGEQQQEQQQAAAAASAAGHCCARHEAVLLQLLARLNWHLLPPSALDTLEDQGLLQPTALLDIYRVHQRCSHMALWGTFPSLALAGERGLRCYSTGGEQVLACESPAHITVSAGLSFTSGKHCWQFVVSVPCDLVWIGLGDGTLAPDVWGGKQAGGWFYGSNDALCHNKHSDRHAYDKHCGHGKWADGAVVDVCLDMDAREVWFSVDGAVPKLGFSGLPDRVYPAVSVRAPAQLLVRFRAASWLMAA